MQVLFFHKVIICQVNQFLKLIHNFLKLHVKKMELILIIWKVDQQLLDQSLLMRLKKVNKISLKKLTIQDLETQQEANELEDLLEIKRDIVENQMKELQQIMHHLLEFNKQLLNKKTNVILQTMIHKKTKITVHQAEEELNKSCTQTRAKVVLMK